MTMQSNIAMWGVRPPRRCAAGGDPHPALRGRGVALVANVTQPSGLKKHAARGGRGVCRSWPRGDQLPTRTVTVDELPIDRANVAEYAAVTGTALRQRGAADLSVRVDVPDADVAGDRIRLFLSPQWGSVHIENQITQYRPTKVTDTVNIAVHAEKTCANTVRAFWSTLGDRCQRRQRRGVASGPRPSCISSAPACPASPSRRRKKTAQAACAQCDPADKPGARFVATPPSVATTTPIHTNSVGAKLFGFPTVIAHGMFSAAAAVLANLEAAIPDAVDLFGAVLANPCCCPRAPDCTWIRCRTAGTSACATSPRGTRISLRRYARL